ncbi:MAG: response regulator [Acidobacteria bacterium]|nr:response regulator [Acidobacteriota bacterium]MBI3280662.1 response regulator [Acidobacteriota bacterium]
MSRETRGARAATLDLARVLVVDDNPTSRLTLQTVLEACGYRVDSAATAAEAVGKLEDQEYELVLSDMQMESPEAGLKVLAHAQMMAYQPATALITAESSDSGAQASDATVLVQPEDVAGLLSKVANLIGGRVNRMLTRQLRQTGN